MPLKLNAARLGFTSSVIDGAESVPLKVAVSAVRLKEVPGTPGNWFTLSAQLPELLHTALPPVAIQVAEPEKAAALAM